VQNSTEGEDFYKNPPRIQLTRLIIWMGVIGLGVCFMPLFIISTTLRDNYQALQLQVEAVQGTLDTAPVMSDADQTLRDDLLQMQTVLHQLKEVQMRLVVDQVAWAEVMRVLGGYDPCCLALTGIAQNARQIILNGSSTDEAAVMRYTGMLRATGLFSQVTIQTLMRASHVVTATSSTPDTTLSIIVQPVDFTVLLELKANEP
jgi:Tfp pilus assembly protein PilN